jgi:hypothetical protein
VTGVLVGVGQDCQVVLIRPIRHITGELLEPLATSGGLEWKKKILRAGAFCCRFLGPGLPRSYGATCSGRLQGKEGRRWRRHVARCVGGERMEDVIQPYL